MSLQQRPIQPPTPIWPVLSDLELQKSRNTYLQKGHVVPGDDLPVRAQINSIDLPKTSTVSRIVQIPWEKEPWNESKNVLENFSTFC